MVTIKEWLVYFEERGIDTGVIEQFVTELVENVPVKEMCLDLVITQVEDARKEMGYEI